MPDGLNKVMLIGNLGQDPELRYTQKQSAVLNMRLATNETWLQDGEKKERTEWHSVVVFGKRAEALGKFLTKGTSMYVEGRLQTRQWEDKSGGKRSTTEIIANEIILLGGKRGGGGGGGGGSGGGSGGGGHDPGASDNYGPPSSDDGQGFGDDDIPF